MPNTDSLSAALQAFSQIGLNPVSVIEIAQLPDDISANLPQFGNLSRERQTLLMVGNSGRRFWESLIQSDFMNDEDPVDSFSISAVESVLGSFLTGVGRLLLYPQSGSPAADSGHLPLQTLGQLAGWHQPSPLGIGIHPEHGLWFAYRAVVLLDCSLSTNNRCTGNRCTGNRCTTNRCTGSRRTNDRFGNNPSVSGQSIGGLSISGLSISGLSGKELPILQEIAAPEVLIGEVCSACKTQDCVSVCPASAVRYGAMPDMEQCSSYRLGETSLCRTQCLARNACPVGESSRYHSDQINHHYSVSLASMKERLATGH